MSGRNDDGNEFGLLSRVVGGLPIVNRMLDRLGLAALIAGALPPEDARVKLAPAVAIRLVVTNLVRRVLPGVQRHPDRPLPQFLRVLPRCHHRCSSRLARRTFQVIDVVEVLQH